MPPWRHWYHCTGNTYGTWLPGDPRGWRSRNHRVHVPGDYKNPPLVSFHHIHRRSQRAQKHPPTRLTRAQREEACRLWGQALNFYNISFEALAISAIHWHLLICCPDDEPRAHIGRLKSWSSRNLRRAGLVGSGPLWAQGCRAEPIRDAKHFENCQQYIRRHYEQGAAVWSMLPPNDD